MELSTPREIKSKKTKQKILDAAIELLKSNDISHLTVKNICKLAGISNGTFFHYFDSKESLIAFYMHACYDEYSFDNQMSLHKDNFIDIIVEIHLHNIRYTKQIGVQYVRSYYNIKNSLLLNRDNMSGESYSMLILQQVVHAQNLGYVKTDESAEEIGANICMVAKGVIFEWGLCGDSFDVEFYIEKMLRIYLNTVITPLYIEKFGK
ncbi:AcrR family transcriptional regulator [Clostridium algifaecis]|uniref:AcrR family transcriptional regulator n=1 Tax=Clostridium algifaecis TaxID=1472040 RepID=A0ABS4KTF3_9CLOT|nr:TetR/AcrR family transcriptional regulator [Clostridium algifaecis]MBP2033330.1 AcrR family transcriptional regulator [Clostridium algifaecis]